MSQVRYIRWSQATSGSSETRSGHLTWARVGKSKVRRRTLPWRPSGSIEPALPHHRPEPGRGPGRSHHPEPVQEVGEVPMAVGGGQGCPGSGRRPRSGSPRTPPVGGGTPSEASPAPGWRRRSATRCGRRSFNGGCRKFRRKERRGLRDQGLGRGIGGRPPRLEPGRHARQHQSPFLRASGAAFFRQGLHSEACSQREPQESRRRTASSGTIVIDRRGGEGFRAPWRQ